MDSSKKTKEITIKLKPLKKEGVHFDIIADDCSLPQSPSRGVFLSLALSICIAFTGLAVYQGTQHFFSENLSIAHAGYDRLKQAGDALNSGEFERAARWFQGAKDAFDQMNQNADFLVNKVDSQLGSSLYVDAAQKIMNTSLLVSEAGEDLSLLLDEVSALPNLFIRQNLGTTSKSVVDEIHLMEEDLVGLKKKVLKVQNNLTTIDPLVLPRSFRSDIKKIQLYLGEMTKVTKDIESHFEAILTLMGDEVPHRYLVLLQNSRERRATGGFIGTYALIDVNDGSIQKIEVKDVYETDGQLSEVIPAPPGIDQVASQLYMRDANYDPDFSRSAQRVAQLLEKSRGPSVDTVIAINEKLAEAILSVTGPVQYVDLPIDITADNFTDVVSFYTEAKISETSTPKQLLIDLIPVIQQKLFTHSNFGQLWPLAYQLIESGDLQAYSFDQEVQGLLAQLKLTNALIQPSGDVDYLSVISTSIGGNKSDEFIKTNLDHQTQIANDGGLINQLSITKQHAWSEEDFKVWNRLIRYFQPKKVSIKTLRYIHGQGDNLDYMRVYVPKGSVLIGLKGVYRDEVSTFDEEGHTVFAFKTRVKVGQISQLQLTYRLPYQLQNIAHYKFIAQRQAGADKVGLKKTIQTPEGMKVSRMYPSSNLGAFDLHPAYEVAFNKNIVFAADIRKRELTD